MQDAGPAALFVRSAVVAHPQEIVGRELKPTPTSVRVVGTLVALDLDRSSAVLEHRQASLTIDVSLVDEQTPLRVGDVLQVFGELIDAGDPAVPPSLRARLVRNVNSLPLGLYERSVESLREFVHELQQEQQEQVATAAATAHQPVSR